MQVKYIEQHDKNDCGAASLAMISRYYGLSYSFHKYKEITRTNKEGTSIQGIIEGCEYLKLDAEALKGNYKELLEALSNGEIQVPFIAHLKEGHFIVVTRITDLRVELIDPSSGRKKVSIDDFENIWSGYIINIRPSESFEKGKYYTSTIKRFAFLVRPLLGKITVVFVLSMLIYVFGIITSFTFEVIIEEFSLENEINTEESENNHKDEETHEHHNHSVYPEFILDFIDFVYHKTGTIGIFFLILLVMYLINTTISYLRGIIVINIAKKVDLSLTFRFFLDFIRLDCRAKQTINDGDYLSRFNDAYRIRYAISNATITLMIDSVLGIMGGIVLAEINIKMFLISLTIICAYTLGALVFQKKLRLSNRLSMQSGAEMQSYFKEVITGHEMIICNSLSESVKKTGQKKYDSMINAYYNNDKVGLRETTLLNGLEMLGNGLILWIGFEMVLSGNFTLASLITFTTILSYFTEPIKNVVKLQPTIQSASVSIDRLYDVFDAVESENEENKRILPYENGDIVFENVSFSYTSDGEETLKELNINIEKNSLTAIMGESGCGKTTLMKLLLGLYIADSGRIMIAGKNIFEYDVEDYRKNIYYVDNNPFMFENSIRYNLVEENDIVIEELDRVCSICQIDTFVNELPMRYESIIRENGASLSQGQKQRLGIARAVLHKPKVLLLDEAMSNLDIDVSKSILLALRKELPETTVVIISHSKELCDICNNTIYINK